MITMSTNSCINLAMAYCLSAVIFTRTEVINGFAQWVNPFRNYVYSGALRSQILPENEMRHQTADKEMWIISRCSVKEKARRIQSSLQVTNNYSLYQKKCWSRRMHWRWPMYKLYISRIEIQSYWNSTGIAITEIDCKENRMNVLSFISNPTLYVSVLFVSVLLRVGFIVLIPFSFYLRSLNAWLSQFLAN